MESSMDALIMHKPKETEVECWDDDEDLHCGDGLQLRTVSATTSVTGSSVRPSGHRDSISSRRSWRSDRDSNLGDDESWQLLLNPSDDSPNQDAIVSAKNAGIPIPSDIPASALLGGSIKRLGGRKQRAIVGDDWLEDLDLSAFEARPKVKLYHETTAPDSLLHLDSLPAPSFDKQIDTHPFVLHDLVKFRDTEEDMLFGDVSTIKITKTRSNQPTGPPSRLDSREKDDDFESELVLPEDGTPLRLSQRRDMSLTSDFLTDDFDTEWAEGSIGVRFGGTRRDGRSNRSSSVGALSPSMSSCLTIESEDDGIDGLILPDGPLDLEKSLQKRAKLQSPPPSIPETPTEQQVTPSNKGPKHAEPTNDDFFSGIEIGDGEAFDAGKLTLNRNVKRRIEPPSTPPRRGATSITFTNKAPATGTRIPRLSAHERPHSTYLEPVSESGAPVSQTPRRPHSRLSGHATHSSLTNIPLSNSLASSLSPPSRRVVAARPPKEALRGDLANTNTQLLKSKRSTPLMRPSSGSTTASQTQISPSRQASYSKPAPTSRPKTPVERHATESRLHSQRRPQVPFLPAGVSPSQSHHVSVKSSRHFRRTDSESSGDMLMNPRSTSRSSKRTRYDSSGRPVSYSGDTISATAKQTITKPTRRKNFGDGTELDIFDDLPTSASLESRFMKAPIKRGAPRSLRSKLSQSHIIAPRTDTPVPSTGPTSPPVQDSTPRFARDTNASRNAREQRITSMGSNLHQLTSVNLNWKTQPTTRPLASPSLPRSRHGHKHSLSRPHLIKPMGNGVHDAKNVKGMQYNPALYKWEGNENATAAFETSSTPAPLKPSPALISNVGGISGSQMVGGMVFDPQRMCWLKAPNSRPSSKSGPSLSVDEEEDVFAGLEDLEDHPRKSITAVSSAPSSPNCAEADAANLDDKSGGESSDEWAITEEFDVGPEFIRRQRAEEEKWRRKVGKWINEDRANLGDEWRWAIRNLVCKGKVG
ncbi:Cytokinesis regulator [Trichophyton interdigitale]|uniref:Cytokinesis regulator n=1 Tax=Trichophyton interdigitale TaxID=101480 RepID=A0A9P5CXT3_9EURO|nr:Cytokinesis regulator [Trichophyton interdigitale]KAF3896152.1 Cytokinesis regulator [Trichophyton interdigitale]KAG8209058.1 Cytokinesis regulator [Trichophyton interdigitale]